MDPDATLREFEQHYREYATLEGSDRGAALDAAEEAANCAATLFEWLARSGYAPNWASYWRN